MGRRSRSDFRTRNNLCKALHKLFGEIKGTLKTRPMFHWNDKRIIGHLVLCFLAYLCEAHLTESLRKNHESLEKKSIKKKIIESRELTVVQAMDELNRVMAIPVKVRKQTIWVRTDIPPNAQNLMKAIGMRIPPKILQKTIMKSKFYILGLALFFEISVKDQDPSHPFEELAKKLKSLPQ